jgi:hypothetical protein
MPLEYISDTSGKRKAVVIPISGWEAITKKYTELYGLEVVARERMPMSAFQGSISKETGQALQKHAEQSRKEWDRNS